MSDSVNGANGASTVVGGQGIVGSDVAPGNEVNNGSTNVSQGDPNIAGTTSAAHLNSTVHKGSVDPVTGEPVVEEPVADGTPRAEQENEAVRKRAAVSGEGFAGYEKNMYRQGGEAPGERRLPSNRTVAGANMIDPKNAANGEPAIVGQTNNEYEGEPKGEDYKPRDGSQPVGDPDVTQPRPAVVRRNM